MANPSIASKPDSRGSLLHLLWRDKPAFFGACFLTMLILLAVLGSALTGDAATRINLRARNLGPFTLEQGWLFVLGADTLGRSILARLIIGSANTLAIAAAAVVASAIVGSALGLIAGYVRGPTAQIMLRLTDLLISLPSLLLALVVLYVLGASPANVVLVLAITRIPVYLRTVYAVVLELRERMYVTAAVVLGAKPRRIILHHLAPMVLPTIVSLATLDFAFLMLTESGLSFLGLGLQPPDISWGLMVAEGRGYLAQAWWISFWPGLAITLTTVFLNFVSEWVRVLNDPTQSWRLETGGRDA